LLAVVPRQPAELTRRMEQRVGRRTAALGSAAIVVLAGLAYAWNTHSWVDAYSTRQGQLGREADGTLLVVGLGPAVIPDDRPIPYFGYPGHFGTAGELRRLMDRYGSPDVSRSEADGALVDRGIVRAAVDERPGPGACRPLTEPLEFKGIAVFFEPSGLAEPGGRYADRSPTPPLALWAPDGATVEVRRFGQTWQPLADVPPGHAATLTLPGLSAGAPWQVRAPGACVISGA
jgi:hypothetical protein